MIFALAIGMAACGSCYECSQVRFDCTCLVVGYDPVNQGDRMFAYTCPSLQREEAKSRQLECEGGSGTFICQERLEALENCGSRGLMRQEVGDHEEEGWLCSSTNSL